MNRHLTFPLLALSLALSGCGLMPFGAQAETAKTATKKPSNVTAHVTVQDGGDPVGYLDASNFHVYENDVLLNSDEIGLRLLSRDSIAAGFTVLLLDLSGAPSETELTRISRGAAHFVEKVSTTQPVTVVAFDGSPRAREVARFAKVDVSTKRPLPKLEKFLSKDSSRDLNSALLAAIKGLTSSLKSQKGEVRYGTLVTLVRGPDLAGRKTDKEVKTAIKDSGYEFYALSPEDVKFSTLSKIGQDDRMTFSTIDTLPMRFQDLGMRVRSAWQSHYLVSYCSPARAGTRKLKVKVKYENESGSKRSASTKSEFDATGFEAGCVPQQDAEKTTVASVEETAPPQKATPTNEKKKPKKKKRRKRGKKKQPESSAEEESDDDGVVAPPSSGKYE